MEKPKEENIHYDVFENEIVSKPKLVFVTDENEKEQGDELMDAYHEVRKIFDERDMREAQKRNEEEKEAALKSSYDDVRKMFDDRNERQAQEIIAQKMKEKSLKSRATKFVTKAKKIALDNYKQVLAICVITTIATCGVYDLGHLQSSKDAEVNEVPENKSNVEALFETYNENQITEKMIEDAMLLDAGREDLIDYYTPLPENMTAEEYDAYMKAMAEKSYEKEQILDGKTGGRK